MSGVYRNKDLTTKVVTLSGPTGGYQNVSEGKASCQLIVMGAKLYVSCNPLGGELLAGWAEAGAQQVGTQWIAYSPSSPDYQQLSTAITTSSDLSALVQNGSIESSGTTFGPPTTQRSGSTTTVTAPLVVRLDGESVPGTESITITGASDPLISSVRATVGNVVGRATLSGWGESASWRNAVRKPAGAAPYSRYAGVLTPSTAT